MLRFEDPQQLPVTPTSPNMSYSGGLSLLSSKSCEGEYDITSPEAGLDSSPCKIPKMIGNSTLQLYTTIFGDVRRVSFHTKENPDKELYEAVFNMKQGAVQITYSDNKTIDIWPKRGVLRNDFQITKKGVKFAECSERIKLKNKKFNYKRKDTGEVLKLTGDALCFTVHRDGEEVAKSFALRASSLISVDLECREVELEHLVCLFCCMMFQRFRATPL
ncbi:sucC [Acrasis kona]|uniref:SucC n=1 Tax=Acrasis kona TaxID=1008807 RepID=A0AAW2YUU7_9EUKA